MRELESPRRPGVGGAHAPYSVFREHMTQDSRYVTFLRDPVSRVRSHYYRHIHRQESRRAGRVKDRPRARTKADSLEEALVEMRLPQLCNLQTRFLCERQTPGEELPVSALASEGEPAWVRVRRHPGAIRRVRRAPPADLRHGHRPRPEAARELRWPATQELSDEQRALIEEHNRLDLELYAFGLELYEEEVAAVDAEELAADVEELRASCAAADEEYRAEYRHLTEWLDRELPAGTTKAQSAIHTAAQEAGISSNELKRGRELLGVRRERDEEGRRVWTRSQEDPVQR